MLFGMHLFSYLWSPIGTAFTAWTSICTPRQAPRATIAPATRRPAGGRWGHFGFLALVLYIDVHVDACRMTTLSKYTFSLFVKAII